MVGAADDFSCAVQVWGATFLVGHPGEPLSRAGTMRLTQTDASRGLESAAGPNARRDL